MMSKANSILARLLWVFDEALLRLDDALDFARDGAARLSGRAVPTNEILSSSGSGFTSLPPRLLHVDGLGIDVADPVDARRAMRLRKDRLSPIDPAQLDWALGWSKENKSWKVGMVRRVDLASLGGAGDQAGATHGLGHICEADGAGFVFRGPAEQNSWRRYRALTLMSLLALAVAFLVLSAAFEARGERLLDHAQAERTRVLTSLRAAPDEAPPNAAGMPTHVLIERLDLVASARPEAWRLLNLRQDESRWTLLFDIPDQADAGFLGALQARSEVASVSARQLGIRNGVTRREFQIVWQEAGE